MTDWILKTDPPSGNVAIFSKLAPITSASSITIGTGARTFTVASGLTITSGTWFQIESTANGANFMIGSVTSYSGTTLALNITRTGGSGTIASWSLLDITPLMNPAILASMQRLHWTSAFAAISTTPALTQQATINIPAIALGATYNATLNLFAHGQAQPCEVQGRIMNGGGAGVHVTLAGSVPVWMQTVNGSNNGFGTFVELGCNATHVVAIVKSLVAHAQAGVTKTSAPAMSLTIEASVFNFGTNAVLPTGTAGLPIIQSVPNSYLQLGRGRIDTRRRYLSQVASGGDYSISKSPTFFIVGSGNTGARPAGATNGSYAQSELGWRWRYAHDGYVRQTQIGWNLTATNGGTAQSEFIRVKK